MTWTVLLVGPATDDLPELSVYSNAPTGGRALWLWLEALGYQVAELDEDPYAVPDGTALRVENDAEGSPYEAHMSKADGSQVTVKVDSNFKVTSIENGHR